jgi:transaldolase
MTTARARSRSPRRGAPAANQLEALKQQSGVVADTGDIEKIKLFTPTDATTNPSLLLQAVQLPQYRSIVESAIAKAEKAVGAGATEDEKISEVIDWLNVLFGCEILKVVPGYVSTEVDAHLSFDTQLSIDKAEKLIRMYEGEGFKKERILIKMGSTWESIQACKQLQGKGIQCNMTLLFGFCQAQACAEAGATLISPFVGRILDWYKKANPDADYVSDLEKDPGVQSVKKIFQYYAEFDYKTIVMGASFRNKGEIAALAGCDKLTIGPKFLEELEKSTDPLPEKLNRKKVDGLWGGKRLKALDEKTFRWQLNEDAMGMEKLAEGIRGFNKDYQKLRDLLKAQLAK